MSLPRLNLIVPVLQMFDGVKTQFFAMNRDVITGQDVRYWVIPDLQYPTTFILMATIVMLQLEYPTFAPEVTTNWILDTPHP